ncbi:uncharacterized protein LOC121258658 [Juglans microcarpa x Juglans regia]|uniref:uncharacterized protein LOC121258658 n=1 Tax=Juglans microcarpa x Juglans regia TaxID=2249226 RepID=UPI001B7DA1F0|nr:uncharacterized protein LOC121258658 [Juglans microcarpa x Juglans regia]
MDVWSQGPIVFQKRTNRAASFKELVEKLHSLSDHNVMEIFSVIARGIWLRRNKLIFEDSFTHPTKVQCTSRKGVQVHQADLPDWNPPPIGFININWDATLNIAKDRIGIGLVAQDCEGSIVASKKLAQSGFMDPLLAEAQGAFQATRWARGMRFSPVILEGHAQQIVKGLNQQLDR